MTRDEALTRLTNMLSGEPVLTPDELSDLLDDYTTVVADADDIYGLHEAARDGWILKAAKVSGDYRLSFDGESLDRQQVFAHCTAMAAYHAGRIPIVPQQLRRTDVAAR